MYFRPRLVAYLGSWFLITRYGKRRPIHSVSESGGKRGIPDILIHFRRLDQARSSGSRGGHQPTDDPHEIPCLFLSLFTSL